MTVYERLLRRWGEKRRKGLSAMQTAALVFGAVIFTGAVLLSLPVASRGGVSCGFLPALFTATSATCVTGLSLFDTYSQWSGFGLTVIFCMIQIGGIGFMSVASLVVFLLRRRVGLKQRMVIAQSLSLQDMEQVVRIQKLVLCGSFGIEGLGALIFFLRFLPEVGPTQAAIWGVFHAVSAFCNAGFDLFGALEPGSSLALFYADPVVLLTISALIIVGGLGFIVWEEIVRLRRFKKFSVYAKLVLVTTLVLLLGGTGLCLLTEWNNPMTLGNMTIPQKLLNGFFQSVTIRTAGFASFSQAGLTEAGKGVTMALMLIGGSSGSTAGGLKTVTLTVLILFLWARARGRSSVSVFRRTIPAGQVMDAMTIAGILLMLSVFGGVFISATAHVSFTDGLYEAVSALATVGLTADVTGKLNTVAQLLIIVYMYFGRVGILTLSLGFLMGDRAESRYQYAHTNLLIG